MEKFKEAVMEFFTTASSTPLPEDRRALLQDRVSHYISLFGNPDHPPYAWMIGRALRELNQKQGSSVDSISNFIKKEYQDLPWSHLTMLKYHLARLCQSGELISTSGQRYLLAAAISDRKVVTKRRKLKRKRGWDREMMRSKRHKKVNKGNNSQKDHETSKVSCQEEEHAIEENKQPKLNANDAESLCTQQNDGLNSRDLDKQAIGGNNQQMLKGDKVGSLLSQDKYHGDINEDRDCITEEAKPNAIGDTDVQLNIAPSLVSVEQPRCELFAGIMDGPSFDAQMNLGLEQPEDNESELATPEIPPGFEKTFDHSSQLQPQTAVLTELRSPGSGAPTLEQSSQFQSQAATSTCLQFQQCNQNSVHDFAEAHENCLEPDILSIRESTPENYAKKYFRRMKRRPADETLSLSCTELTSPELQREEQGGQCTRTSRVLRSQTGKQNQPELQKPEYPIHKEMLREVEGDPEVMNELTDHQSRADLDHNGPKSKPSQGAVRHKMLQKRYSSKKQSGIKARGRPPKSCIPAETLPDRVPTGDIASLSDEDQQHYEHPQQLRYYHSNLMMTLSSSSS